MEPHNSLCSEPLGPAAAFPLPRRNAEKTSLPFLTVQPVTALLCHRIAMTLSNTHALYEPNFDTNRKEGLSWMP